MDGMYPAHRYPSIAYNINIECWPKRRRAVLSMLDNIHRQKNRETILLLAGLLAEKCETNFHPMCATLIRYHLARVEITRETNDQEEKS